MSSMITPRPVVDTTTNQVEPISQTPSAPAYSRPPTRFRGHQRRSTGMSISPSMALAGSDIGDGLSGRATRQRTQLIVEGFTNLALVAVLFSGVQAQLVSVTNEDNSNPLAVATNAVFFGGLMLSVFSALLATLAGRWFSILREDDSEFLSSCWLAAECNENPPNLEDYVRFQLRVWEDKLSQSASSDISNEKDTPSAECPEEGGLPNPRDEDIKRVMKIIEKEKKEVGGDTTIREHIMSKVLLSALGLVCGAFGLFCAGIVMFVWNKQPRSVAIFTSAIVVCCISLLPMLFLEHRHKHVISKLNLRRPTF
ncbi:hypothetical protein BDV93DRAFT_540608 [Ceratobasidium sp. AG-I]|nr:hypothetical protein BDV93DRAFT_540608 [Ceratobasidium sp. AG-I]